MCGWCGLYAVGIAAWVWQLTAVALVTCDAAVEADVRRGMLQQACYATLKSVGGTGSKQLQLDDILAGTSYGCMSCHCYLGMAPMYCSSSSAMQDFTQPSLQPQYKPAANQIKDQKSKQFKHVRSATSCTV